MHRTFWDLIYDELSSSLIAGTILAAIVAMTTTIAETKSTLLPPKYIASGPATVSPKEIATNEPTASQAYTRANFFYGICVSRE